MTRQSVRVRGLLLLAASMAFAACAPLPTADSDPKPTTTNKKKASPSPSASASTAASASPSTQVAASVPPSTSPSPSASPSASTSPSASPSPTPTPLAADALGGKVYDEKGALVTSGKVRVVSLNVTNDFDKTVDITNGAWQLAGVPSGIQLSISATRDGWTTRFRVEALTGQAPGLELNFGGPATAADAEGPAFFISDYPEIVEIEPFNGGFDFAKDKVALRIVLSEPLDATNQRRFTEAFHVMPGELAAAGNQGVADTNFLDEDEQSTKAVQPFKLTDAVYSVNEDSTFLGSPATEPIVSWNEDGDEMLFTFNTPVLIDENEALRYVVALFGSGEAIVDKAGKRLGTDETGQVDTTPGADELVYFSFRELSLSVPTGAGLPGTANARWQATHDNFFDYTIEADETDPTLTGVTVTNPTIDGTPKTRFSLTFSEPMAAFGGGDKGILGELLDEAVQDGATLNADQAAAFTFAVAEGAALLDDVELDGDSPVVAAAPWGDSADEREEEFRLNAPRLSVNPSDPKVVRLEVNGTLFADEVNAIKARVEALSDPAGNSITEFNADTNEKVGNI